MSGRFSVGDAVSVRTESPPGHVRTPWFIRGASGVVDQIVGDFPNPEELAYGRPGLPAVTLYRVRFRQSDVWDDYAGGPADTTIVDIYDHWLEKAS